MASFPYPAEVPGQCMGPAKNEGNEITQWIWKMNGQVVLRCNLQRLRPDKLMVEGEKAKRAAFNAVIRLKYGDLFSLPKETLQNSQNRGGKLAFLLVRYRPRYWRLICWMEGGHRYIQSLWKILW